MSCALNRLRSGAASWIAGATSLHARSPSRNPIAPTAYGIAVSIGERFGRIYENPYETPTIEGVELNFDLVPERRSARLENARTDVTEARPGDTITIATPPSPRLDAR